MKNKLNNLLIILYLLLLLKEINTMHKNTNNLSSKDDPTIIVKQNEVLNSLNQNRNTILQFQPKAMGLISQSTQMNMIANTGKRTNIGNKNQMNRLKMQAKNATKILNDRNINQPMQMAKDIIIKPINQSNAGDLEIESKIQFEKEIKEEAKEFNKYAEDHDTKQRFGKSANYYHLLTFLKVGAYLFNTELANEDFSSKLTNTFEKIKLLINSIVHKTKSTANITVEYYYIPFTAIQETQSSLEDLTLTLKEVLLKNKLKPVAQHLTVLIELLPKMVRVLSRYEFDLEEPGFKRERVFGQYHAAKRPPKTGATKLQYSLKLKRLREKQGKKIEQSTDKLIEELQMYEQDIKLKNSTLDPLLSSFSSEAVKEIKGIDLDNQSAYQMTASIRSVVKNLFELSENASIIQEEKDLRMKQWIKYDTDSITQLNISLQNTLQYLDNQSKRNSELYSVTDKLYQTIQSPTVNSNKKPIQYIASINLDSSHSLLDTTNKVNQFYNYRPGMRVRKFNLGQVVPGSNVLSQTISYISSVEEYLIDHEATDMKDRLDSFKELVLDLFSNGSFNEKPSNQSRYKLYNYKKENMDKVKQFVDVELARLSNEREQDGNYLAYNEIPEDLFELKKRLNDLMLTQYHYSELIPNNSEDQDRSFFNAYSESSIGNLQNNFEDLSDVNIRLGNKISTKQYSMSKMSITPIKHHNQIFDEDFIRENNLSMTHNVSDKRTANNKINRSSLLSLSKTTLENNSLKNKEQLSDSSTSTEFNLNVIKEDDFKNSLLYKKAKELLNTLSLYKNDNLNMITQRYNTLFTNAVIEKNETEEIISYSYPNEYFKSFTEEIFEMRKDFNQSDMSEELIKISNAIDDLSLVALLLIKNDNYTIEEALKETDLSIEFERKNYQHQVQNESELSDLLSQYLNNGIEFIGDGNKTLFDDFMKDIAMDIDAINRTEAIDLKLKANIIDVLTSAKNCLNNREKESDKFEPIYLYDNESIDKLISNLSDSNAFINSLQPKTDKIEDISSKVSNLLAYLEDMEIHKGKKKEQLKSGVLGVSFHQSFSSDLFDNNIEEKFGNVSPIKNKDFIPYHFYNNEESPNKLQESVLNMSLYKQRSPKVFKDIDEMIGENVERVIIVIKPYCNNDCLKESNELMNYVKE